MPFSLLAIPLKMLLQLTKEQLLAVLPLLIRHLASNNYVSYSYAAITIERILFIKRGTSML
jgi:exportin-2 (importin alpha re-exporter)